MVRTELYKITNHLGRTLYVKARSMEEATEKAEKEWKSQSLDEWERKPTILEIIRNYIE